MCDIFALCCNSKDRATRSLPVFANEFSGRNPHGWGIGYYDEDEAILHRSPEQASRSNNFFTIVDKAKSNIIVAHIRLKTRGHMCEENCHPFKTHLHNKDWIFAHNGVISLGNYRHSMAQGQTDSENVFHFMMDKIREYSTEGNIRGNYPAILDAIKKVFERFGTAITFNFLLSDGRMLYVFNHYPSKPIYFLKRNKEYGGAIVISTQKLSDENWIKIPADRLLVLHRGEVIVLGDRI